MAGESGEGVISAGEIATLAISDIGYNVFTFESYPAEIKGGHCWYQVRASNEEVLSAGNAVDVLCAFNQEAIDKHLDTVRPGGVLIYDPGQVKEVPEKPDLTVYEVNFDAIVKERVGNPKSKNVFAVAVFAAFYDVPAASLKKTVRKKFKGKNPAILEKNDEAVDAAYQYVSELDRKHQETLLSKDVSDDKLLINGNDAIALGALVAGIDFFAGYPITPASSILEALSTEMPKLGKTILQAEDEMAALAMCLGASYAGKKAMTATSGPGISLMQELMGLASTAELPVVIANAMRGGPSTGLPTKMEQSDLNLMALGSHGEASRIVIAPSGVRDCFYQTIWAFNLAEKYQVPVYLATDHSLANRTENVDPFDIKDTPIYSRETPSEEDLAEYKRYKFTDSGVSPMSVPGTKNGMYVAEGIEHNEFGHPAYTGENHTKMIDKRMRKIANAWDYPMHAEMVGDENAELVIVTWGSMKGPVKEATMRLLEEGHKVSYLCPKILCPLPKGEFAARIGSAKQVLVVESNFTGQLAGLLKREYDRPFHQLNRVMGSAIPANEIVAEATKVLNQHVEVTA